MNVKLDPRIPYNKSISEYGPYLKKLRALNKPLLALENRVVSIDTYEGFDSTRELTDECWEKVFEMVNSKPMVKNMYPPLKNSFMCWKYTKKEDAIAVVNALLALEYETRPYTCNID